MKVNRKKTFETLAVCMALICGCTEKADHSVADAPINSSADVRTTNETLRVNQPRAFQHNGDVVANGTNVVAEPAGATVSSSDRALSERVKTALQTDPTLTPVIPGIQVSAKNGKVTIVGAVQNEAQKQRVFEMTRDLVGEDNVENKIEVKTTSGPRRGGDAQTNTQPNK